MYKSKEEEKSAMSFEILMPNVPLKGKGWMFAKRKKSHGVLSHKMCFKRD